jgi:tetratricopeptide (TPR) repeat protein
MVLEARGLIRRGRHVEAEAVLAACVAAAPDFDEGRFTYARMLVGQTRAGEALPHAEHLLARDPRKPAYRQLMAGVLAQTGDPGGAAVAYKALLADDPGQLRARLQYGHVLRVLGRRDEAITAYRACLARAPDFGEAYWSLANLKVAAFTADEEAAMRAQLSRPNLPEAARLHLHYALGKALEDAGAWGESFGHYAQGARIRLAGSPHAPDAMTALVDRSRALYTRAFFAERAGAGSDAPDPIFVLGLPRSGSTLVEQILASHPAVEGVGELPNLSVLARSLGRTYPDATAGQGVRDLAALGDAFVGSIRAHRRLGRPLFVDKTPHNLLHIGLIHLILPKARIIDVRRHPMSNCFSAFKQHFAEGAAYTYDLAHLGRYYRDYVALMDHFDAVLPGRIHRVVYEDLVDDAEGQVRRLLDHCGLPFDAVCLSFHQNGRGVRTPSSEQVRRPIFREGLDHWRRYEPWLDPLKAALGSVLEDWRGAR